VLGVLKASRKVEVHFVDFGNREVVECEELRDMPAMILNDLPVQAVACSLYGVEQTGSISMWNPADVDAFSDMVYDQLLEVYFTRSESSDGHYLVHLIGDNRESINRKFLRATNRLSHDYVSPADTKAAGDASRSPTVPPRSSSVAQKVDVTLKGYQYKVMRLGEQADCVAAYVISPSHFYLHKQSNADALGAMMDRLNADYEKSGAAQTLNATVGQPCCALYSEDGRWYRAKVVSMSDDRRRRLSVDFVDYGNRESVDGNAVLNLRPTYTSLPVQALHCRLADVVPVAGSDWSDDAAAVFEELIGDAVHAVKVVSVDGSTHTVEMKSVAQKLVERGLAKQKAVAGAATMPGSSRTSTVAEMGVETRQRQTQQFETRRPNSLDFNRSTESQSGQRPQGGTGGAAMESDMWGEPQSSQRPRGGSSSSGFTVESDSRGDTDSSSTAPTTFTPLDITADTRHSVVVSWVVSPCEFYCQLVDNRRVIEQLSADLRKTYQSTRDHAMSSGDFTLGKPCVAFYAPDKSWYRGRIVSRTSDEVTVFYVDYGNTEVVNARQVRRPAPPLMKSPPVQAVKCCLRGAEKLASTWTKNECSAFDKAVSAPGLPCRFLNRTDGNVYSVELSDKSGRDLTSQFCTRSVSGAVADAGGEGAVSVKVAAKTYVHECGLKANDSVQVEVVYVAAGSTVFNCHVIGRTDDLDELMAELAGDCEQRPALSTFPDVGRPCAALYSEDSAWYRATIDGIPADNASHRIVKFVDYGNIESCSVSSLRELDSRFLRVPVRRVNCRLRGMTSPSLDTVANDLLGLQFTATVVVVDRNNVATVELVALETGEPFASTHSELFARTSMSLPTTPPPDDDVDVYVTHVVSPSDFYIQTASVESQLTELAEQLMEEYDASGSDELKLSEVNVASLCCARYSADGSWYRAIVEDIKDDSVTVRFVDYGNSDVVSRADVRRLTDRFVTIPACAWHCQLSVQSTSAICWTDEQQQQFVDLAAAGEKLFTCKFVSRSQSPYHVSLKDGDVDIGQDLYGSVHTADLAADGDRVGKLPVAEAPSDISEVCITSAESPSDFYVQLTSGEDELSQLADELLTEYDSLLAGDRQLTSIEIGGLCCARYSADSAWYRAVITEILTAGEVRVLFIDYGNSDILSTSTDVKLLHEKFCTKPSFVYHCTLGGLSRPTAKEWSDDEKTRFIALTLTEDELPTVFSCQFVSRDVDTGRYLVSLKSAEDVDVCGLFADTADVSDTAAEGREVTSQEEAETTYQPAVISSGKHRVSHCLSLSVC